MSKLEKHKHVFEFVKLEGQQVYKIEGYFFLYSPGLATFICECGEMKMVEPKWDVGIEENNNV